MKTINITLISIMTIFLLSCEKEIHITNPKLFVNPMIPHMYDTITSEVIAEIKIEGEKVEADRYEWEIFDDKNTIVPIISQESNKMLWIPKNTGIYTVSCNIVSGNKSLKSVERYQIDFYPPSLYKYLIGKWVGHGKIGNEKEWYISAVINVDYSVTTKIDSVILGNVTSSIGAPGEDPQSWHMFYIMDINENNTFGGSFLSYYGLVVTKDIVFNNTFDEFQMVASYVDYTVEDKDRPNIDVNYDFKKIK